MHIRRGDVGEASGYALTQQLDPSQLSRREHDKLLFFILGAEKKNSVAILAQGFGTS